MKTSCHGLIVNSLLENTTYAECPLLSHRPCLRYETEKRTRSRTDLFGRGTDEKRMSFSTNRGLPSCGLLNWNCFQPLHGRLLFVRNTPFFHPWAVDINKRKREWLGRACYVGPASASFWLLLTSTIYIQLALHSKAVIDIEHALKWLPYFPAPSSRVTYVPVSSWKVAWLRQVASAESGNFSKQYLGHKLHDGERV